VRHRDLAIDELGAGESSPPLSTDLPIMAVASATHQIVQALRGGSATGTRFSKVIPVGHWQGGKVTPVGQRWLAEQASRELLAAPTGRRGAA
jgi:hypothetical protein